MNNKLLLLILGFFFAVLSNGTNHTNNTMNDTELFASSSLLTNQYVNITINLTSSIVTIMFTGPINAWHGIGFGSTTMNNTYAIIVDGNGAYQERRLGNYEMGTLLLSSILTARAITTNNSVTSTLTLNVTGMTSEHYTFPTTVSSLAIIYSQGGSDTFNGTAHKTKGSKTIFFQSSSTTTSAPSTTSSSTSTSTTSTSTSTSTTSTTSTTSSPSSTIIPTVDTTRTSSGAQIIHSAYLILLINSIAMLLITLVF